MTYAIEKLLVNKLNNESEHFYLPISASEQVKIPSSTSSGLKSALYSDVPFNLKIGKVLVVYIPLKYIIQT